MLNLRSCLLLGTFGFCLSLPAQNLVYNPSFEDIKPNAIVVACEFMQYSQYFGEKSRVWTTDAFMTPDLLRAADNCPWLPKAHTGEFCIGIVTYLPASDVDQRDDYHERVRGRLRAPLQPGQRYRVECWVREESSIVREHLSKVYTPKTPVVPTKAGNLGFYFYIANRRLDKEIPQVNFAKVIETNGEWVKLSAEFVPDQPFEYFQIGNFYPDRQTPTNLTPEQVRDVELKNGKIPFGIDRVKRAAYICLDDISVEPAASSLGVEKALLLEHKFTFSAALLFDSGKSELRPEAGPELDSLVSFLKNYPKIRLGISGHTDNVGTDEYNLDLSERRALAVQQYLQSKGIPPEQTRAKGFGETKPIGDNLTEFGRQTNRRVECVVLK